MLFVPFWGNMDCSKIGPNFLTTDMKYDNLNGFEKMQGIYGKG
jgi:hypothetical protein